MNNRELLDFIDAELGKLEESETPKPTLVVEDAAAAKKFLLTVPKMAPNESWGSPESISRDAARKFLNRISGADVAQKLGSVNKVISGARNAQKPGVIISYLVFLESLSAVLKDFSASSAGFVFEGFLAALLGGKQIADPEDGSLPIEDIVDSKGNPISLKLLRGDGASKTPIKGSFKNLVDGIGKFPQGVKYLVVRKTGEEGSALDFWEFTIGQDNLFMLQTLSDGNAALFKLTPSDNEALEWVRENGKEFDLFQGLQTGDYGPISPEVLEKLGLAHGQRADWGTISSFLSKTMGYTKDTGSKGSKTQWKITQPQMMGGTGDRFLSQHVGALDLSESSILQTAEFLMGKLQGNVVELLQSVSDLSTNINDYFTMQKRDQAIAKGESAERDASKVEQAIGQQTKSEKEETK